MTFIELKNILNQSECRYFYDFRSELIHDIQRLENCPNFKISDVDFAEDIRFTFEEQDYFRNFQKKYDDLQDASLQEFLIADRQIKSQDNSSILCRHCIKGNNPNL